MKKRMLMGISLLAMLLGIGLVPQVVDAAAPVSTRVTGVISHDGSPMADAEVTVTCGAFSETDTTDAGGSYLVTFAASDCPLGSTAQIKAKKGDMSGTATGEVQGVTTKLNTAVVNASLPEYGLIAGLLATGAGGGAIIFARRRTAQQNSII